MLNNAPLYPTIPITDLERSIDFYQNKLGLKRVEIEMEDDSAMFETGKGTKIYLYKRAPSKADHTLASFEVDDLEEVMDQLEEKGVEFERYDLPNLKTDEKGVMEMGDAKAAWFKDPDGNIFGIVQVKKS